MNAARPSLTPAFRPLQLARRAPCQVGCAASGDVRGWIGIVAQRGKTGRTRAEAYAAAWTTLVERNPFPAVLGRVCPHPCETDCNRSGLDEPVSVNALERFLGDWAIAHGLALPRLDDAVKPESIGVVGAGPSGLSFAYQMARRGYAVTVYEQQEQAGGMLRYGIPNYRLPPAVLDAEIARIVDLGVEIRLGTGVGRDVTFEELASRHEVLYLAIGAQRGRPLGVPGDDHAAAHTGSDYLASVNRGERPVLGARVAVVGGGNTAIDAARTARRSGADVTILYRRSRDEMPAIESEVEDALAEGVAIEYLVAPVSVDGAASPALTVERMELGEPDDSGRRRPVPVTGSRFELAVDAVVAAVSQEPDWCGLESVQHDGWLRADASGLVSDRVSAGGDVLGPGRVADAVLQGRRAAEAVHARLRDLPEPAADGGVAVMREEVLVGFYAPQKRARPTRVAAAVALLAPDAEVHVGIEEDAFLAEVDRCFSCGSCFGCQQCWMYCNAGSFEVREEVAPGGYFALSLDACEECGKCVEVCPCAFLVLDPSPFA